MQAVGKWKVALGVLVGALSVALATHSSCAGTVTQIPIVNPGFEDDVLDDGMFDVIFTGWMSSGGSGPFNPSVAKFPGEAPEGLNAAFNDGDVISQILIENLTADTLYVLKVEVGNPLNLPFSPYFIELRAGGVVLATDFNTLAPEPGEFMTSLIAYGATNSDPNLGQPLEIRLIAATQQAVFDNVRLEARPLTDMYEVDTTSDDVNDCGCTPAPDDCSLRAAIALAQAGDSITFAPAVDGQTITLTNGQLTIEHSLSIDGDIDSDQMPNVTVSGDANGSTMPDAGDSRVFLINAPGSVVSIDGLTITNGFSPGFNMDLDGGGAIRVLASQQFNLTNSVVSNSIANFGAGLRLDDAAGLNDNILNVFGCRFEDNAADEMGGAIFISEDFITQSVAETIFDGNSSVLGGAMFLQSMMNQDVIISDCQFTQNVAEVGAGFSAVLFGAGLLDVIDCEFDQNTAIRVGGGAAIALAGDVGNADALISRSRFTNNQVLDLTMSPAQHDAGALFVEMPGAADPATKTIDIVNSVFTGNSITTLESFGRGGAIAIDGQNGEATIAHSTIHDNTVFNDTTAMAEGLGQYLAVINNASLAMNHTILAADMTGDMPKGQELVAGTFTSDGFNLFSETTTGAAVSSIASDLLTADAGDLADGDCALPAMPVSDAIDAGDPTLVAGMNGVPDDDICGNPRIFNRTIDIGAVESGEPIVIECPGDLNDDLMVDQSDLGILLAAFMLTDAGDLNDDNMTTQADLGILLANFGADCTMP